jgi:hypothetical protein
MAISRALAAAALACVGLGCDVGSPRAPVLDPVALPDSAPTLAVEVGTGEGVFEPIAQGTVVDAVYGPQGGYHVWTAVRVTGAKLSSAQINVFARLAEGGASVGRASRVITDFGRSSGPAQVHAGITNFVDNPSAVSGKAVVLRVEVLGPGGEHGEDERTVRVR